jgi:hypothetical protein
VRVDSHLYSGYTVPPNYDSLIGKVITWGEDRERALMRMRTALDEIVVDGIRTNIPLHQQLVRDEAFMRELFARAPEGLITIIVARNLEFGAFAAGLFLRDASGIRYWNAGGELAARALSPGILLFAHGLQMAITERKQTFDFLRGNESYKYEVGAADVDVLMMTVPAA